MAYAVLCYGILVLVSATFTSVKTKGNKDIILRSTYNKITDQVRLKMSKESIEEEKS